MFECPRARRSQQGDMPQGFRGRQRPGDAKRPTLQDREMPVQVFRVTSRRAVRERGGSQCLLRSPSRRLYYLTGRSHAPPQVRGRPLLVSSTLATTSPQSGCLHWRKHLQFPRAIECRNRLPDSSYSPRLPLRFPPQNACPSPADTVDFFALFATFFLWFSR